MQIRVVNAQPWDVRTDVLAIPVSSDGEPDDAMVELDRRLDGALDAYRTVGELRGTAWASALVRGRDVGAAWVLGMGVGEAASFDRVTALRLGAAVERRLAGRAVTR